MQSPNWSRKALNLVAVQCNRWMLQWHKTWLPNECNDENRWKHSFHAKSAWKLLCSACGNGGMKLYYKSNLMRLFLSHMYCSYVFYIGITITLPTVTLAITSLSKLTLVPTNNLCDKPQFIWTPLRCKLNPLNPIAVHTEPHWIPLPVQP